MTYKHFIWVLGYNTTWYYQYIQNNQLYVIKSTRFRQINQQSNQPRSRVDGQPYLFLFQCVWVGERMYVVPVVSNAYTMGWHSMCLFPLQHYDVVYVVL